MEVRVGRGLFLPAVGRRLARGQGLVSQVWQTAQSFVVDDYARWPDRLPDSHLDVLRSAVGIPLISGLRVVGVLLVAHTEQDREIPFDEIALLSQFAALAAIAVDNRSIASSGAIGKSRNIMSPANGSSRSMNLGRVTRARVISSRRRSPPDSESALLFRRWPIDSSPSSSSNRL